MDDVVLPRPERAIMGQPDATALPTHAPPWRVVRCMAATMLGLMVLRVGLVVLSAAYQVLQQPHTVHLIMDGLLGGQGVSKSINIDMSFPFVRALAFFVPLGVLIFLLVLAFGLVIKGMTTNGLAALRRSGVEGRGPAGVFEAVAVSLLSPFLVAATSEPGSVPQRARGSDPAELQLPRRGLRERLARNRSPYSYT